MAIGLRSWGGGLGIVLYVMIVEYFFFHVFIGLRSFDFLVRFSVLFQAVRTVHPTRSFELPKQNGNHTPRNILDHGCKKTKSVDIRVFEQLVEPPCF